MAGKQSTGMDLAQRAIEARKMNKEQAAAKYGVSAISISRKGWYKEWIKAKKEPKNGDE